MVDTRGIYLINFPHPIGHITVNYCSKLIVLTVLESAICGLEPLAAVQSVRVGGFLWFSNLMATLLAAFELVSKYFL